MPDPHRIERELRDLLSRPAYVPLFIHRNEFRKPGSDPATPGTLATETTAWLLKNRALLDPVSVEENRGESVEFYRAFDGNPGGSLGAATLGRCWFERSVLESVWNATKRWPNQRPEKLMQFLRAANFIDPKWNLMKEIACMRIVGGSSVVVIKGRGNWKALLSEDVRTPADLEAVNQMVALPGTVQCVVPLFNDMWVAKVPRLSPSWPFISGSAR